MKLICNLLLNVIVSIWSLWVFVFGRADFNSPYFKWFMKCWDAKDKSGGIVWNEFLATMKFLSLHYIERHDEAELYITYTDYVDMTPFTYENRGRYSVDDWDMLISMIYGLNNVEKSRLNQPQDKQNLVQEQTGITAESFSSEENPVYAEPDVKINEVVDENVFNQPEESIQIEQSKADEPQQEESRPVEEETYVLEEEKKSRTWVRIIIALLLLGVLGGGYYYFMIYKTDAPEIENNNVTITSTQEEALKSTLPTDPKEYIKSMYKDFFENRNFDTQNISNLHKYLSPSVVKELKMECPYDGGEGDFSYVVEFFCDGGLSYERPDYGDRVVYRTIESEDDGWYKVTNIWDVIKDPVIVYLQVKSVNGALKIVDIRKQNRDEDDAEESVESSTDPIISIEKLRNKSFDDFDKLLPLQGFSKIFVPSEREGYGTDVWYKNCEVDNKGEIKTRNTNSCYIEVFDGMSASVRITVFEKELFEQIKSEVLKYSERQDNGYHFKWSDDYATVLIICMGVNDFIKGGYYIDIPDH